MARHECAARNSRKNRTDIRGSRSLDEIVKSHRPGIGVRRLWSRFVDVSLSHCDVPFQIGILVERPGLSSWNAKRRKPPNNNAC